MLQVVFCVLSFRFRRRLPSRVQVDSFLQEEIGVESGKNTSRGPTEINIMWHFAIKTLKYACCWLNFLNLLNASASGTILQ